MDFLKVEGQGNMLIMETGDTATGDTPALRRFQRPSEVTAYINEVKARQFAAGCLAMEATDHIRFVEQLVTDQGTTFVTVSTLRVYDMRYSRTGGNEDPPADK